MAVVSDVRKIGLKFTRTLSLMAVYLSSPLFSPWKKVTRKCTQSATASVSIRVGADAEGGVSTIPIQPAVPIAVTIDIIMTINDPSVPQILRVKIKKPSRMMPNAAGISVLMSANEASGNALFMTTTPVL